MASRYMKIRSYHSSSGKCKYNQMRHHLIPVRIAIVKNITNNKYWRGYREAWTLVHWWWEYKLVQPLWKSMEISQKLKTKFPQDSVNSTSMYITKENKQTNKKETSPLHKYKCISIFILTILTIIKVRQHKCPSTTECINRMWCICNFILCKHRKEWNCAFCNNMDQLGAHLVK